MSNGISCEIITCPQFNIIGGGVCRLSQFDVKDKQHKEPASCAHRKFKLKIVSKTDAITGGLDEKIEI